jgi:hypothetical protein
MPDAVRWDAALAELGAALNAGRLAEVHAAFRQAMSEFGIPEHPDGECPPGDCPCLALEPLVIARVSTILAAPAGARGVA